MHLNSQAAKALIRRNIQTVRNFFHLGLIQGSNALIQILLIPVITRTIGLGELGHVSVAASVALVAAILVNYGSNQSGVKDVALLRQDPEKLAGLFFSVYYVRLLICSVCIVAVLVWHCWFRSFYSLYCLLALPIVLTELFNPFFFFVGIQQLGLYNIMNLSGRIVSAVCILFFVHSADDGPWVNFYLGIGNSIAYALMLWYALKKFGIHFTRFSFSSVWPLLKTNAYLTGNNLSVQLQQSFFLFTISATAGSLVLGAYSLCDRIIMAARMIIISFSNAIYPKAALGFRQERQKWSHQKRMMNIGLFFVFSMAGLFVFALAPLLTKIITGTDEALTVYYMRCISFVPLVAALNSLNVIDLLLKSRYDYIFRISVMLLLITITSSMLFYHLGSVSQYGYYLLSVEVFSIPLYLYYIARTNAQKSNPAFFG
ncbi:lipopolysaccharide biosynthesis protein [Sediminibacterium soli]|uniref:lipopolysaccharide biosynthesis protein n=1 Tax=Sediminibacterium soli TaxID=2698829 RepID=UPI001379B22D|nr:lipopolysaccharide biosynthesis protein [Sediminibacterium soli]NCI48044.1 lipopolysaccharide biosynthesis protein [Sediminibacterium soli]